MDLASLTIVDDAEEGGWLTVQSPSGGDLLYDEKNPVRIRLKGRDSSTYRQSERVIRDKRIDSLRNQQNWDAKDQDNESLELLSACFIDWEGVFDNGDPLECTPENARRLMRAAPFIFEQVDLFVADRANFTRG